MNAYLESVLNVKEYQKAKNILINQKQVLKDKLKSFEQKSNNRFELAEEFIKTSKQAKIIASKENPEGIRDFLKKIGSNFQIQNQNISFCPRGAWQIVAKKALFAQSATFAELRSARNSAETDKIANWRWEWDSNPQALARAAFRERFLSQFGASHQLQCKYYHFFAFFTKNGILAGHFGSIV